MQSPAISLSSWVCESIAQTPQNNWAMSRQPDASVLFIGANILGKSNNIQNISLLQDSVLAEGVWTSKVGWVNDLVRRLLKSCASWDILLVVSFSGLLLLVSLAGSASDILAATVLALRLLELKYTLNKLKEFVGGKPETKALGSSARLDFVMGHKKLNQISSWIISHKSLG